MDIAWTSVSADSTDYLRSGYVWIKSASVVTQGYAYGCTIDVFDTFEPEGSRLYSITITPTTPNLDGTVSAATSLESNIHTELQSRGIGSADSSGSIIKVTMNEPDAEGRYVEIRSIEATDTFGDMASFGWGHNVETLADLPKSMAEYYPVVEVGSKKNSTYWLQYKEGVWKEFRDPAIYTTIDPFTMPHVIVKRFNEASQNFEFYVEQYNWDERLVGSDETNKIPSFTSNFLDTDSYIKDVFFFRNRLGFITKDSIIMSEVGEYGNFFRTTVASLLDGDRIDSDVESFNAVNLEYATLLEDSVMLFADKAQFRFSGGDILSPASYSIQQEMAYDVNTEVRPLFMNDRIFFVANRGRHSAVYEMTISDGSSQSSEAIDVTAHCQTYVDANIERLTGSAVNNMLFLTSRADYSLVNGDIARNTVFAYKYHNEGRQKAQSAWFKWTFDGDIISGFAISKNFYLLIDRTDAIKEEDWILSTGEWRMDQPWKMDGRWIMSPESLDNFRQFERLAIHPKDEAGLFLDNYVTNIDGYVALGEYVYGAEGNKDIRGKVQMKTIEVDMSSTSHLEIWVHDRQRLTDRTIPSKFNKKRKPMIYGDSKNIRTGFRNEGDRGFRVEMVSFESRVNKRAKAH